VAILYEGWARKVFRVRPLKEDDMPGMIQPIDFKVQPFLTGATRRETRRIRREHARSMRAWWALERSWCLGPNRCPQNGALIGDIMLQERDVALLHEVDQGVHERGRTLDERRLLRLQRHDLVHLTEHHRRVYWELAERMARLMKAGFLTSV